MVRVVLINLTILTFFLLVLELIFGTWFTREHALYQFAQVRNHTIVRENPLPNGKETITYTRDEFGFRGLQSSVSEIDVLTVGGSTTDQRWIDDSETFQAVLSGLSATAGHPVSIVNAGIDGQSTFGHIKNFPSWFSKIPDLRPKYILYYVGINDVLKLDSVEIYDTVSKDSTFVLIKGFIKEHSVFYQVYRIVKSVFAADPIRHELTRTNIAETGPFADKPLIADPLTPVLAGTLSALQTRVGQLSVLTEKFGAKAIFVSQRSARWFRDGGKIYGIIEYEPDFFEGVRNQLPEQYNQINGVDFYNFEKLVAEAIISECRAQNAICLDLMAELDFDNKTDFYDPIHTTPSGSRRIAEYLFHGLRESVFKDLDR